MTPDPKPSCWTTLLNQSRTSVLLVMPTTAGPTASAARTTGVLRASERLRDTAVDATGILEPPGAPLDVSARLSVQPAKSMAPTANEAIRPPIFFFHLFCILLASY